MGDASITAVIPVHNRADLLARLLATVAAQTAPFAEVLVVDNASMDNAARVAREAGCRVIAMGENAGFARAVNRGWQAADTPSIAVLNSDVELIAVGWNGCWPAWHPIVSRRAPFSPPEIATSLTAPTTC